MQTKKPLNHLEPVISVTKRKIEQQQVTGVAMSEDMPNNLVYPHQTPGNFPFEQEIVGGKIKRDFSFEVDEEELKWHYDLKDRHVTVLEAGGWQFQLEDGLPNKILDGQEIFIPKLVWHRVIKGEGNLKVSILEVD
jgi:hypothetical protein